VVEDGATHTYWKYCLRVDGDTIVGGSPGLGAALKERGIWSAPRYIQKPAFRCQVFRDQVTFGNSRYPFTLARPEAVDYDESLFPGTFSGLEGVLVMPWNEKYTDEHVNYIGESVREAVNSLAR
jgi:dTDP-4-amino-4,6-dideoxygalactose transaminase